MEPKKVHIRGQLVPLHQAGPVQGDAQALCAYYVERSVMRSAERERGPT